MAETTVSFVSLTMSGMEAATMSGETSVEGVSEASMLYSVARCSEPAVFPALSSPRISELRLAIAAPSSPFSAIIKKRAIHSLRRPGFVDLAPLRMGPCRRLNTSFDRACENALKKSPTATGLRVSLLLG